MKQQPEPYKLTNKKYNDIKYDSCVRVVNKITNGSLIKSLIKTMYGFTLNGIKRKKVHGNKALSYNLFICEQDNSANLGTLLPLINVDPTHKIIVTTKKLHGKISNIVGCHDIVIAYDEYTRFRFRYLKDLALYYDSIKTCDFKLIDFVNYTKALSCVDFFKELHKSYDILSAIHSNDTEILSCSSILTSQDMGVSDFVLQHGFPTQFYVPTQVSNYILWGDISYRWFLDNNHGENEVNYHVLGSPRMDLIVNKYQVNKIMGVEDKENIILYMSHSQAPEFSIELHRANLIALSKLAKEKDFTVMVKPHPSENVKFIIDVIGGVDEKVHIVEGDLHELIIKSKICASAFSTTLIEAMILNKPTLQMNMANIPGIPDYSISGGCVYIDNYNSLCSIIDKDDYDDVINRQQMYVDKYFYKLGFSVDGICKLINNKNIVYD